jgi:leader peptidase (prepilin peptidase)/N-methyltransferase
MTAGVYAISVHHFGLGIDALKAILFFSVCFPLVVIDFRYYLLPDILTFALFIGGLTFALAENHGLPIWLNEQVLGGILGYSILYAVNFLYKFLRKRDGFGGGDLKLMAGLGLCVGWRFIVPTLGLASLLALGTTLVMSLIGNKQITRNSAIPFGPFLIISSTLILIIFINNR